MSRVSDDDNDAFLDHYPLPANPAFSSSSLGRSGGLASSKSTVYVSNLDLSLTNSDLHQLFSTFGHVARITILTDPLSRHSKGVSLVTTPPRPSSLCTTRSQLIQIASSKIPRKEHVRPRQIASKSDSHRLRLLMFQIYQYRICLEETVLLSSRSYQKM